MGAGAVRLVVFGGGAEKPGFWRPQVAITGTRAHATCASHGMITVRSTREGGDE